MKNFPGLFSYLPAPLAQFIVLFRSTSASICGQFRLRLARLIGLSVLAAISSPAQIQQAWVARYNNGVTNGTHQAVKMALDASGYIYITGFSQNTNGNSGYATIKYAPNGNQLWTARYDSTNFPSALPVGLALDINGNTFVTGTALTAKYATNGNQLWTAPYAGTALAVSDATNIVVTGFGTNFNTVKLTGAGSNVWTSSYVDNIGPTLSQVVLVDGGGNVYLAGQDNFVVQGGTHYQELRIVKYDHNAQQLWTAAQQLYPNGGVKVVGATLDDLGNLYFMVNSFDGPGSSFLIFSYANNGVLVWSATPDGGTGPANGLALNNSSNLLLVGQDAYQFNGAYSYYYTTFKLNPMGSTLWVNHYPQPPFGSSAATAIAVDQTNNVYITGYSPGTNSSNNIVTIKYDNNGNQLWLESYSGPGGGGAAANAIAVDAGGNVYVTGYETVAGGGTEMVTIKYAPGASLQKQTNGAVLLKTQGNPGESFDFQASTNLQIWQDLGTNLADTNGQVQFLDTNAPLFPHRFYLTNPQPTN